MRNQARTAFTAVLAVPITPKGTPPGLEGAQGNAELTAGAHKPGASGFRPDDQLERRPPLGGTRQPSGSLWDAGTTQPSCLMSCRAVKSTGTEGPMVEVT